TWSAPGRTKTHAAAACFAFSIESRSEGIREATGPARSQRFHQPYSRRTIWRSAGGFRMTSPAIGRRAASARAGVVPQLAAWEKIGRPAARTLTASYIAIADGTTRFILTGPSVPPEPG